MSKITVVGFFVLITLLASAISYFAVRNYKMTHFSCSSLNVIIDGSHRSSLRFDMVYDGDKGISTLDGVLDRGDGVMQPIRLINTFKINHNQSVYTFTHTSNSSLTGNKSSLAQLNGMIPGYLTVEGTEVKMVRFSQGKDGYVFTNGSSVIYCGKSSTSNHGEN